MSGILANHGNRFPEPLQLVVALVEDVDSSTESRRRSGTRPRQRDCHREGLLGLDVQGSAGSCQITVDNGQCHTVSSFNISSLFFVGAMEKDLLHGADKKAGWQTCSLGLLTAGGSFSKPGPQTCQHRQ